MNVHCEPLKPLVLGAEWHKSSRSMANGDCVEVRLAKGAVEVRDSKDSHGVVLRCQQLQWMTFIEQLTCIAPDGSVESRG